jgi:hypothetical protein
MSLFDTVRMPVTFFLPNAVMGYSEIRVSLQRIQASGKLFTAYLENVFQIGEKRAVNFH